MSRVPRIRFKGFEEDWEQRKLGEIADKVVEKNFQLQERDVFTNSAEFGIIDQKDFFDHEIVNKNNIGGYYIVSPNDFVYNPRISVTAPVGPINRNKLCKRGIMSPLYTVFHPRNMNETFLEFYFRTNKWHKFMEYNGDSGARSDRFSIKTELFYAMTIPFPSHKEQSKVGICFESLDQLITLHQRKVEKLKIIKKSMLENLFPQNGEKTPKIRFSGFTEDWEQRKFVELFLEKRDKTQSEDEDVLLSCAITGIYLNSELFSHFRGTSNIGYLKIKKNDLILSAQNLHLGNANVNLLFEHGIISPAYKVYELNECDQYFVQSWVKKDSTKDFFLNATTEGASQCRKNIDWCILNNQLIVIPSLYEQVRIGKLFNSLNHLITLHQFEPFQLIFKAIAYRIIDYTKSKPPSHRK